MVHSCDLLPNTAKPSRRVILAVLIFGAVVVCAIISIAFLYYHSQVVPRRDARAFLQHVGAFVGIKPSKFGMESVRRIDFTHSRVRQEEIVWACRAFPEVEEIDLGNTAATDETVAGLACLRSLTYLDLSKSAVSDRGIAFLRYLPRLETLYLVKTDVTDRVMTSAREMPSLKYLYLDETLVTRDAVRDMARERLTLVISWAPRGSDAHGRAAARIKQFGGLLVCNHAGEYCLTCRERWRGGCDGLQNLAELDNLTSLLIEGEWFTDTGMANLAASKGLKDLTLVKTRVSLAACLKLKEFPDLKKLTIVGGLLDEQAIAEIKLAIPGVTVIYSSR